MIGAVGNGKVGEAAGKEDKQEKKQMIKDVVVEKKKEEMVKTIKNMKN
jgi:hypothetical protein